MKRIKEKFARTVKYWRIRYRQASGQDRFYLGMYIVLMLAYTWWVFLVR